LQGLDSKSKISDLTEFTANLTIEKWKFTRLDVQASCRCALCDYCRALRVVMQVRTVATSNLTRKFPERNKEDAQITPNIPWNSSLALNLNFMLKSKTPYEDSNVDA
jgi:hypothetical protein